MTMTTTITDEQFVGISTPFLDIPYRSVYTDMLRSVYMVGNSTSEEDDQAWFWTAEWQEGEQEATAEIQRGQLSKPLHSVEEIGQYLSEL